MLVRRVSPFPARRSPLGDHDGHKLAGLVVSVSSLLLQIGAWGLPFDAPIDCLIVPLTAFFLIFPNSLLPYLCSKKLSFLEGQARTSQGRFRANSRSAAEEREKKNLLGPLRPHLSQQHSIARASRAWRGRSCS
jgi:hypothetical protein